MNYFSKYESFLGNLILVSDGEFLTEVYFEGEKVYKKNEKMELEENDDLEIFSETKRRFDQYFAKKIPDFLPKMKLEGSDFKKRVLEILQTIPYGQTTSYKEIADEIARERKSSMSAQAVGQAVGKNPIGIIIPCHRVVGKNGNLTGYGGGIDRKIKLLELENVDTDKFFIKK
jgi:O-6-methylguanine DNA methyltransferase